MSKKYTVNQGFISLPTYCLEDDRHLARLYRRRRRAYAPTSNTASRDNHEKITSWVTLSLLYGYGAPLKSVDTYRGGKGLHIKTMKTAEVSSSAALWQS